jgi:hypothetical protein
VGLLDQSPALLGLGAELLQRDPEIHGQRHQPGLGPIVQVALDAAELSRLRVGGRGPAHRELGDPADQAGPAVRADQDPSRGQLEGGETADDPGTYAKAEQPQDDDDGPAWAGGRGI